MRAILSLAALAVSVLPSASAAQGVQDFKLKNRTGYVINEVYVAPTRSSDWEEDVLGRDVLDDGESVDIHFSPREDVCHYDIRVVYSDGDDAEWSDFNLCVVSKISLFYNFFTGETTAEYE
jgi:hypothetical protein